MLITENLDTRSPFPSFGELFRVLANAFDVNQKHAREIGRLAREGDYDWSVSEKFVIHIIGDHLTHYFDQDFSDYLVGDLCASHSIYTGLILSTQVDALDRKELVFILKDELANSIYISLQGIGKIWKSPDLNLFISPDHSSFKVVLAWVQDSINIDVDLIKYAYPDATHQKQERRNIERWCSGRHLPDLISIDGFATALSGRLKEDRCDDNEHWIDFIKLNLKRWLLLARVLEAFCQQARGQHDIDLKKILQEWLENRAEPMTQHATLLIKVLEESFKYNPMPPSSLHILEMLENKVIPTYLQLISGNLNLENFKQGDRLFALQEPRYKMLKALNRDQYFVDEVQKKKLMHQLEELKVHFQVYDPDGRTRYELERLYGRFYLLCGDFKKAIPHYDEAIHLALYRAGQAIEPIFEEVLCFYAHIKKMAKLKQLKNRGIALGLLKPPLEGDKVTFTDEELEELQGKFRSNFPKIARLEYAPK